MRKKILRVLFWAARIMLGLALAVLAALMGAAAGCTPAYPPCQSQETARWRCNGDVKEMCDGTTWNPRVNCAEQWNEDGELVPEQCVEHGDTADCEAE